MILNHSRVAGSPTGEPHSERNLNRTVTQKRAFFGSINYQLEDEIFYANGEVVDLIVSEMGSHRRFIESHGVEIGEDTGVYALGDLTSPLQSRCTDALQEHSR